MKFTFNKASDWWDEKSKIVEINTLEELEKLSAENKAPLLVSFTTKTITIVDGYL